MKTLESIISIVRGKKIDSVSPVFEQLKDISENDNFHDNDPVFDHTCRVMENLEKIIENHKKGENYFNIYIGKYSRKELLLVSAIFHDTGKLKVYVNNNGKTACPGHEEESVLFTGQYFKNELGREEIKYILGIIKNHGRPYEFIKPENAEIEAGFEQLEKEAGSYSGAFIFPDLLFFVKADIAGSQLRVKNKALFDFINKSLDKRIDRYFSA